jgi:hypothetical protein
MDVPTLEFGYTSATTGRGDREVHKGHVVALGEKSSEIIVFPHFNAFHSDTPFHASFDFTTNFPPAAILETSKTEN